MYREVLAWSIVILALTALWKLSAAALLASDQHVPHWLLPPEPGIAVQGGAAHFEAPARLTYPMTIEDPFGPVNGTPGMDSSAPMV